MVKWTMKYTMNVEIQSTQIVFQNSKANGNHPLLDLDYDVYVKRKFASLFTKLQNMEETLYPKTNKIQAFQNRIYMYITILG